MDVAVCGISLDSVDDNRNFAEKYDYPYPLLSDEKAEVARAFGAVGSRKDQYASRYTFVIGPDGRIEHAIDVKEPAEHARQLSELLAAKP